MDLISEIVPLSVGGMKIGYMPDVIEKVLKKAREKAKLRLAETGADHVVYAIKRYNDRELEEIVKVNIAMDDKLFRAMTRAPQMLDNLVLAVHNCNSEQGKIESVVDFIVETGMEETSSGADVIFYEEISNDPDLAFATEDWLRANHEEIKYALDGRKEILSETWDATDLNGNIDGFDVNFCGMYCPHWEEDSVLEAY